MDLDSSLVLDELTTFIMSSYLFQISPKIITLELFSGLIFMSSRKILI